MSAPRYILRAGDINRLNVARNAIAAIERLDTKRTFVVEIKQYQKPRSDVQNKALWGCAYKALLDQTGNDPEDLHEFFCGEFFGWNETEVMGRIKKRPRRTTTTDEDGKRDLMSTLWFYDFYEYIQRKSAENGFEVPDPDPFWKDHKDAARSTKGAV